MVVFIIGLATGLVVLTMPPRATPEQSAAKAFSQTMTQAQDQAILSGQPIGLILLEDGYSLAAWRAGRWETVRGGQRFQHGLRLDLRSESKVQFPDGWPDIVFDSTGVSPSAELRLRGRSGDIDITLAMSGEVRINAR